MASTADAEHRAVKTLHVNAAPGVIAPFAQVRRRPVPAARRDYRDDDVRQQRARLQPAGARLPRLTRLRSRQEDRYQLTRASPVAYNNNNNNKQICIAP